MAHAIPYVQCQTELERYLWWEHHKAMQRVQELEQAAAARDGWLERLEETVSGAVQTALSKPDGPLLIESLEGQAPRRRKRLTADEVYEVRVRNAARARLFKNDLSPEARKRAVDEAERLDCVPEDFDVDAFLDDDDELEVPPDERPEFPEAEPASHSCIAMEASAWLDEARDLRVLWFMRRLATFADGLSNTDIELILGAARTLQYRRRHEGRAQLTEQDRYANHQLIVAYQGDVVFYPNGTPFMRFGTVHFPDGSPAVTPHALYYPGYQRALDMMGWHEPTGDRVELDALLAQLHHQFPGDADACEDALNELARRDRDLYRMAIMELAWLYLPRQQ